MCVIDHYDFEKNKYEFVMLLFYNKFVIQYSEWELETSVNIIIFLLYDLIFDKFILAYWRVAGIINLIKD